MQQILVAAAVGLLIGVVATGIPAILFSRVKERAFQKEIALYKQMIAGADDRTSEVLKLLPEYMDRWYVAKNTAPGQVDVNKLYEEQREESRERAIQRKNGGALPPRIGKLEDVVRLMQAGVESGKYERPV